MPLISTLIDNFNDNVIGPEWGNAYGGVSEVGGRARVPCAVDAYAGYQTGPVYTLAGSSVYLQIPVAAPAAGASVEAQTVFAITPDPTQGTNLAININTVGNTIRFESNVGYSDAAAVSLTYSAATHLWLRIRETGGNVLWDTSPDGTTWTTRRTLATPAWVASATDLSLDLWSYRNNGAGNYAEFDNVNTLTNGAVIPATGAGSAQTNAIATTKRTVPATGAGVASANATAATRLTAHITGAGAAESHAEAALAGSDLDDATITVRGPMLRWRVSEPWI